MCRSDHYLDEEPRSKRSHHQPAPYFNTEHFENFAIEPLKFNAAGHSPAGPTYEIPLLSVEPYEPPYRPPPPPSPSYGHEGLSQGSYYRPPYSGQEIPADLPPPADFGRSQFPFLSAQAPAGKAYGGNTVSYAQPPPASPLPLAPPEYGQNISPLPHHVGGGTSAAAAATVHNSNQFVNVEAKDTWESGHVRGSPSHSRQEYSRREGRTFKQQVRSINCPLGWVKFLLF